VSQEFPLREAVALGLIQGPAELLPISSSSHTALIPWLLRWRSAALDVELRRSFEVALHAGTAAALVVDGKGRAATRNVPPFFLLQAVAPPAAVGYLLEGFIDRRLSRPPSIALGLLVGAACMAAAERGGRRPRRADEAGAVDGLLLGGAQVFALAPGISRNGATLAVARARGFSRTDADALSWQVGVPVIVGAGALKVYRAARRGYSTGLARQLAAGALAAFCSTLLSARLLGRGRAGEVERLQQRDEAKAYGSRSAPLTRYAAYRFALAVLVACRLRRQSAEDRAPVG
jgi:undecaprenyl-diphosphatase